MYIVDYFTPLMLSLVRMECLMAKSGGNIINAILDDDFAHLVDNLLSGISMDRMHGFLSFPVDKDKMTSLSGGLLRLLLYKPPRSF